MNTRIHEELAGFIWGICNLLRGPYKRNEYREVVLPLTVLLRFDCVLADTKRAVLDTDAKHSAQSDNVQRQFLVDASGGRPFYNTSAQTASITQLWKQSGLGYRSSCWTADGRSLGHRCWRGALRMDMTELETYR